MNAPGNAPSIAKPMLQGLLPEQCSGLCTQRNATQLTKNPQDLIFLLTKSTRESKTESTPTHPETGAQK